MRSRAHGLVPGGCAAVLVAVAVAAAAPSPTSPPTIQAGDDGRTFVYTVRAGDTPASIARAFGLDEEALGALLVAQGATDWSRVRAGERWQIPNPLAPALDAAGAKVAALESERDAARAAAAASAAQLASAAAAAHLDEAQRARLADLERRWTGGVVAAGVMALLLGVGLLVTLGARRREQRAVRWARAMSTELEERRRSALSERQQAARRVIELEERIRHLELPPRAVGESGRVRLVERQG